MSVITNREEFLFLYDVKDANPNGDPLDENKPRIDEETGINIVTDVRLKRTIRDFLFNFKEYNGSNEKDIFVRSKESEKGGIQDGKERAKDFEDDAEAILKKCIDIRLFGAVIPLDKDSIKFTGPIQFKMGRSLHNVELKHMRGTGAFSSQAGKKQQTFREEYILPYSLIAFYGVINENAAKATQLSEEDVELFYEAMWEGTNNLISRSKMGHRSRLLVRLKHKKPHFFIGDLDRYVSIDAEKSDLELRDVSDYTLDLSKLSEVISAYDDEVKEVELKKEPRVTIEGWDQS
jgi:CRISPR-associated protein Csh2